MCWCGLLLFRASNSSWRPLKHKSTFWQEKNRSAMTNEFFFKEDATFCELLVAKYQFLIKWTRKRKKYKNAKKTNSKIFYQNSETVELFVLRTRTHTFFLRIFRGPLTRRITKFGKWFTEPLTRTLASHANCNTRSTCSHLYSFSPTDVHHLPVVDRPQLGEVHAGHRAVPEGEEAHVPRWMPQCVRKRNSKKHETH